MVFQLVMAAWLRLYYRQHGGGGGGGRGEYDLPGLVSEEPCIKHDLTVTINKDNKIATVTACILYVSDASRMQFKRRTIAEPAQMQCLSTA